MPDHIRRTHMRKKILSAPRRTGLPRPSYTQTFKEKGVDYSSTPLFFILPTLAVIKLIKFVPAAALMVFNKSFVCF